MVRRIEEQGWKVADAASAAVRAQSKSPPPRLARAVEQRTRGRTHGPVTRLMSPSCDQGFRPTQRDRHRYQGPWPDAAGTQWRRPVAQGDHGRNRCELAAPRHCYVDLYQIHRWDYDTPIEETLEALHDLVKAGKARYIGASSMHAWQFARALGIAERHGWTRFVSMQNLVNLLYREEEREMLPLCAAEGIGVIPWSPQARGKLTRDWNYTSIRTETDEAFGRLFAKTEDADRKVVDRVAQVAAARSIPRAQVALAWLLAKPVITSASFCQAPLRPPGSIAVLDGFGNIVIDVPPAARV
jgi:hypothetical protein